MKNRQKARVVEILVEDDDCLDTDEALVRSAKDGSREAFAELIRRYSSRLSRIIYSVAHSHEDAEDALQDALMRAFVHLHNFDGRAKFSA